jgi:regulator of protease activity HflC (stomatin/prohibitin superfamily)
MKIRIKNVAFKFIDDTQFNASIGAYYRRIYSWICGYEKDKQKYLSLRKEIVEDVKDQIDQTLEAWGYHLLDLQLNDITFDEAIIKSMAQVVASANLKAAAENEGQALLITKTKAAEADGNAIKIAAEAERTAAQLRGQGVALFREEVVQKV